MATLQDGLTTDSLNLKNFHADPPGCAPMAYKLSASSSTGLILEESTLKITVINISEEKDY